MGNGDDHLTVGAVAGVAVGHVDVDLTTGQTHIEHAGRDYPVGRIGSYLVFPAADRNLVGFVTASRRGTGSDRAEGGTVLQVQLLGEVHGNTFARGINAYPLIGDPVRLAVQADFETIFCGFNRMTEAEDHQKAFRLGRFALNTSFDVNVLGTEFFAKHVAVVGNSGSGKSCATAKILQEVLDLPQAQVVMFDMHGEYRKAFSDEAGQIDANATYLSVEELVLPYWLLKYEELESLFVDESNPLHITSQISFLRSALLEFKEDAAGELGLEQALTLDTPVYFSLQRLKEYAENLNEARFVLNSEHLAFSNLAMRSMDPAEQQKLLRRQRCPFNKGNPQGETPHPIYHSKLIGLIDRIDTLLNDRRYEFLLRPIEHAAKSRYFRDQLAVENSAGQMSAVLNHLIKLLTGRVEPRSNLTIIDLSGIPFEVVDVAVAVLTRLMFDVNFWTPASDRHPICLVYEEAHNYIPRVETRRCFAKKAVERVAKEGRKYGVSAMVVSQRPSELSETVLAQCNNLLVMRLSNPDDQHYIARVVSDHFTDLIKMLPILRPGEGFVIGDSVMMPMRTLIDLPEHTPQSGNVDFFRHWSNDKPINNVDDVVDHWCRQDRNAARPASAAPARRTVRPSPTAVRNSVAAPYLRPVAP
ncbi:MAG: ATP-binding protein [Phycisphaerales bacterium]|nr:ATP-binding protein [Phycisphaerales bacterium]